MKFLLGYKKVLATNAEAGTAAINKAFGQASLTINTTGISNNSITNKTPQLLRTCIIIRPLFDCHRKTPAITTVHAIDKFNTVTSKFVGLIICG